MEGEEERKKGFRQKLPIGHGKRTEDAFILKESQRSPNAQYWRLLCSGLWRGGVAGGPVRPSSRRRSLRSLRRTDLRPSPRTYTRPPEEEEAASKKRRERKKYTAAHSPARAKNWLVWKEGRKEKSFLSFLAPPRYIPYSKRGRREEELCRTLRYYLALISDEKNKLNRKSVVFFFFLLCRSKLVLFQWCLSFPIPVPRRKFPAGSLSIVFGEKVSGGEEVIHRVFKRKKMGRERGKV